MKSEADFINKAFEDAREDLLDNSDLTISYKDYVRMLQEKDRIIEALKGEIKALKLRLGDKIFND